MCSSFKSELMLGIHCLGAATLGTARGATTSITADTVKAALYLTTATVNAATTAYSATNEVSGTNYTAGGATVTNATAPSTSGTAAIWTPSASISWTTVTLSTAFDCVLLYNSSQSNRAISAHTFGAQTVTAGNFSLTMPTNAVGTALLQIS
jgi:hypothetical protein